MKKTDFEKHFKKEAWRLVEKTNYYISNFGRILLPNGEIAKLEYSERQKCHVFRHRPVYQMVAKAFPDICGEWFEGCHVHHINHNRMDSCANNLIVLTAEEHMRYHADSSITKERKGTNIKIREYDKDWTEVYIYQTVKECCSLNNLRYGDLKWGLENQVLDLTNGYTENEFSLEKHPIAIFDKTLLVHKCTYENISECSKETTLPIELILFFMEHHFMSDKEIEDDIEYNEDDELE